VPLVNQIWFVIGKVEDKSQGFKALCINKEVGFDSQKGNIGYDVTSKQYCIGGKPIAIYWDADINSWKNSKYVPLGSFAVKHDNEVKFIVVQENVVNKDDASKNSLEIIGAWNSRDFGGNIIPVFSSLDPAGMPKAGDKITLLYKAGGKYIDGPEVTLSSLTITRSDLEAGEYCGAFHIVDVVGRRKWSYYKPFTIDAQQGVKSGKAATGYTPVSDNESL
jgi:hypothetical protein